MRCVGERLPERLPMWLRRSRSGHVHLSQDLHVGRGLSRGRPDVRMRRRRQQDLRQPVLLFLRLARLGSASSAIAVRTPTIPSSPGTTYSRTAMSRPRMPGNSRTRGSATRATRLRVRSCKAARNSRSCSRAGRRCTTNPRRSRGGSPRTSPTASPRDLPTPRRPHRGRHAVPVQRLCTRQNARFPGLR